MKTLLFIIFSLNILIFISCNKDEDYSSPYLVEYNVNQNYVKKGEKRYIWFTDNDGNIINSLKLENGMTGNIPKPENYSDKRFSLHELNVYSDGYTSLWTFADIESGKLNFKSNFFDYGDRNGSATLKFSNLPKHDGFFVSYGYGYESFRSGKLETENIPTFENYNQAYVYLTNDEVGYYKFIDNFNTDDIVNVNGADFKDNMSFHSVNLTDDKVLSSIRIRVHKEKNNFYSRGVYIFGDYYFFDDKVSSASFHIPNDTEFSKTYTTTIRLMNRTNPDIYYYYRKYGKIPNKVEYIDAGFENYDFAYNNLHVETFGTFDYLSCHFGERINQNYYAWTYYGSNGDDIRFPQIPEQIGNLYPDLKMELLLSEDSYSSVFIEDIDNIHSYDEVIERFFYRKGLGYLDGIGNARAIAY